MMQFGEILREIRGELELSQSDVANKTGIPLRTIQGWERSPRSPVSPVFFQLIKKLGISSDRFANKLTEGHKGRKGKPGKQKQ